MSSLVQTQPRTGRRSFTLRAYLAGTAATAALLGAVVVVFASLGTYVAFNGLPIGGDQSATDATSVTVAPAAPSSAAKRAHRQQALNATAQNANTGGSSAHPAKRGSSANETNGGDASSGQATVSPAAPTTPTGTSTAATTTGGSNSTPTAGSAPQSPSSGGAGNSPLPTPQVTTPDSVSSTLGTVEQTLHGAGVDVPLSQAGSTVDQITDGLAGGG
jgi:hypothetical protein